MSVKAYLFLWLIGFATAFFIINVLFIFVDMNSSAYDFHLGAFLKNAVLHLAGFRHIYISQVGTITESVVYSVKINNFAPNFDYGQHIEKAAGTTPTAFIFNCQLSTSARGERRNKLA